MKNTTSRHKAYKATLDKGYAAEWYDDHIDDYTDEISFQALRIGYAVGTEWSTAQTSGGSAPVWTLVGAAGAGHATVVFNTGGTTSNVSSMRYMLGGAAGNITSIDDLPIMTFTMQIDTVHTAGKVVEAGLIPSATALFTANQDGAYFRVNNDTLYAVTGDGANETATDLGAFDEYAQYRILITTSGATTRVYFYVDDMVNAAATHTTNLPNADMTIKISVISANNVDSTIRVDACALQVLRKQ